MIPSYASSGDSPRRPRAAQPARDDFRRQAGTVALVLGLMSCLLIPGAAAAQEATQAATQGTAQATAQGTAEATAQATAEGTAEATARGTAQVTAEATAQATAKTDAAGHWRGVIELPGSPIEFYLDLSQQGSQVEGTFSAPGRNLVKIPLTEIELEGSRLSFALGGRIGGTVRLEGDIEGEDFTGAYFQGGGQVPFTLRRGPNPVDACREALRVALEESWPGPEKARIEGVAAAAVCFDEIALVDSRSAAGGMDAETPVLLGETSEIFTAFLVGALHDEGILSLDATLAELHPTLPRGLSDRLRQSTVADILSHRTGLAELDVAWRSVDQPAADQLLAVAGALPAVEAPRIRSLHNSVLYAALVHLIEEQMGAAWSETITTRVFEPLELSQTALAADLGAMAPAVGMTSSASDLARFVQALLGGGRFGRYILTYPQTLARAQTTHVSMGNGDPLAGFGLGWELDSFHGATRVRRGDQQHDIGSDVSLLPGNDIGIAVLVRGEHPAEAQHLAERFLDLMLAADAAADGHGSDHPASDHTSDQASAAGDSHDGHGHGHGDSLDDGSERQLIGQPGSQPPRSTDAYAGVFFHPAVGQLTVTEEAADQPLQLALNDWRAPLAHERQDIFRVIGETPLASLPVHFLFDAEAVVVAVEVPLHERLPRLRFDRQIPDKLESQEYWNELTGVYGSSPDVISISVAGDSLRFSRGAHGQGTLVPTFSEDIFTLDISPNTRIVFRRGFREGDGFTVVGLDLETPKTIRSFDQVY